ncbi:hypothetical protein [Haladaptatus sp. DYSN1]|uniref:DUF7544 domain-containing protein n=1 Tax=unclassified Haladaptatus TaxID=2622732 RepID=UPI0024060281|nr:hypothetical protein [Haladaptatus sp. DYSN1]
MSWYAIDGIEDSIQATREFLFPFDFRKWLKLALIVFFIGGVSGGGGGTNFSVPAGDTPGGEIPPIDGQVDILAIVLVIGVVVGLLALLFGVFSSVFQFVFVDAVRSEEVRIRGPFNRWFGKGVRLFVFTLVLVLLILAPFLAIGAVFIFAFSPLFLILLIPFLLIIALLLGIGLTLTTDFVVPVMMREDLGVIAGWRRFWPILRAQWKQYGLFVILRWLLGFAAGILAAIALAVVLLPVLGIAALLGFGIFTAAGGLSTAVLAFLVILAIPLGLLVLLYILFVQVPFAVFFRYYALFVLGDSYGEFDLIPAQRRAVRAEDESTDEVGPMDDEESLGDVNGDDSDTTDDRFA